MPPSRRAARSAASRRAEGVTPSPRIWDSVDRLRGGDETTKVIMLFVETDPDRSHDDVPAELAAAKERVLGSPEQ